MLDLTRNEVKAPRSLLKPYLTLYPHVGRILAGTASRSYSGPKEVAGRGIRVNTIHPGPVDNAFQHEIEETATGRPTAEAAAVFEQMIPLGRHARPEEVARAVLYLAAEASPAPIRGPTIGTQKYVFTHP